MMIDDARRISSACSLDFSLCFAVCTNSISIEGRLGNCEILREMFAFSLVAVADAHDDHLAQVAELAMRHIRRVPTRPRYAC